MSLCPGRALRADPPLFFIQWESVTTAGNQQAEAPGGKGCDLLRAVGLEVGVYPGRARRGEEAEKGHASFLFAASCLEAPLGGWAACSEGFLSQALAGGL